MTKWRRKASLLLSLPLVVVATMQGVIQPAAAQGTPSPDAQRYTVTLLTGDVVTVVTRRSGCPLISVKPAKPSGVQVRGCGPDGHARVVPLEAAPLLGSVLDPKLFDVTTLIQEGYDDASTKELPLIVRQEAGLAKGTALKSIGSVALKHPKGTNFLQTLGAQAKSLRANTAGTASALVRLDRRVRVTQSRMDRNLTQVSAPQAWESGHTGKGVKVAVLDTGADFTHPDLAGQVSEQADFTVAGGDASDGHGHGTHVATTIAGTGAAARGERKGVAPEAKLVIGKVLDDHGFGEESDIIAGMEWAAARAKVVNMSLGGWEPSDGTDPMSQALNALTAQHGTLFVVASGNDGPDAISSPAAATEALTVGAVDGNDRLAWFSSHGPVINTRAAKPELVAPGVDIVAGRAAGTSLGRLVDDKYTALSGTSMATPHVAGGAAILAQRYPDWTPAQLKSALVGAVDPLRGNDTYVSGSGRLNVARALKGAVSAQPIVNLGAQGTEAKLSWSEPVQTSLSATDRLGKAVPAGAVTLQGSKLTVNRASLAPGFYTATVTAKGRDSVAITPVTFYVEPPSFDVHLTATLTPGTDPEGFVYGFGDLVNLDDPSISKAMFFVTPGGPGFTMRVPAGRYSILGSVGQFSPDIAAIVGSADITIAADTAFVLDGAKAKPVTATVEGVDTVPNAKGITYEQSARRGQSWYNFAFAWGDAAREESLFASPVGSAGVGKFETFTTFSLLKPGDEPSPFLYDLLRANGNGIPADLNYRFTRAEQSRLIRIDQLFHRLDTDPTYVQHKRYGFSPSGIYVLENDTDNLPHRRTDYLSPGYGYVDEAFYNGGIGFGVVTQEGILTYEAGSRHQKTWVRQPLRPDWYDNPATSQSGCEPTKPSRTRGNMSIMLVPMTDQHQRFTCFEIGNGELTLEFNGEPIAIRQGYMGEFAVPEQAGTYRLTHDVDASGYLPVSNRVVTAWTFRSGAPKATASAPLPLLSVDYALPLDANNHPAAGRASFTVRQAHGVPWQFISSFALQVSTDDGVTWQQVIVRREGLETFSASLPQAAAGQFVSLRVKARGTAGSEVEQTIIRAYR